MRKNRSTLLNAGARIHKYIFVFAVGMLCGCADDIDRFIPDPELKGDIGNFFDAARDDIIQTTSINIDFPTAVVTPRKTVLIFQPKSLIDAHGNIASGVIDIGILELLTKGEILLYGLPTHSYEKLLSSGGEFHISALQDGNRLTLRPGMPVRILTDLAGAPPAQRMELFYGTQAYSNVLNDSIYTWDEADSNPNIWDNVDVTEWVALADSQQIVSGFGYESFSDRLDWINFDVFLNIPTQDKTNLCVTLPEEFGNVNTRVFLVFDAMNSIALLPGHPQNKKFCNYYQQDIRVALPLGERVTLVVISEQGEDNYFFALVNTTLETNHELDVFPQPVSLEEIKLAIRSL